MFKLTVPFLVSFLIVTPLFAADEALRSLQLDTGDESANEMKSLKAEVLVRKSEDLALAQLRQLLKKYRKSSVEESLLFRLGELHMRRAKTERFFELHKGSETVARLTPERVKNASQKKEINLAIGSYVEIKQKFPRFEKIDLVLFNEGFARQLINDDVGAEKAYWQIIKQFPQSMLVPDAHLAIGEINYEKRGFQAALEHFLRVAQFPQSRAYTYGIYKAAWTYYNLQNAPAAMEKLEQVVKHGQHITDNGLDARLDLRKEALRDMALFYGDVYEPAKAVEYFMKQSRELDGSHYLVVLLGIYKRHGKYAASEVVLKDFIKRLPKSEKIVEAYDEYVWNYERMLNRPSAVKALAEYSQFCSALHPERTKEKFSQCQSMISETSFKLGSKWQALWKKNNKLPEFAQVASQAYEIYILRAEKKTEEMAQLRYNYGELLFNLNKFREASAQYAEVRKTKPTPVLLHDSDYAAIVSLEKAVNDTWNDADEKKFRQLSEDYFTDNPQGTYVVDLQFKRALIAYQKGRYAEAEPQFKELGWKHLKTEKGLKAQDLYLDILNLKKDYGTLKTASHLLIKLGGAPDRLKALTLVYQQAYFALIQTQETKVGSVDTAVEYKKFATENKASSLAPEAWWNASQIYFQAGKEHDAAMTCMEMPQRFPQSPKIRDCLVQAAKSFESMGQLSEAAEVLLSLAERDKDKRLQWLELGSDFLALSRRETRAYENYEKLQGMLTGKERERMIVKQWELASSADSASLKKRALASARQYQVEPVWSESEVEEAEALFQRKKDSEAFRAASVIVGRKSASTHARSRARYIQAQVLEKEFESQSVKARVDRLGMVLAMKTEKLEKAQRAYQEVINYKDPAVTVQALERLSALYVSYAKSIRSIEAPAGTSEADKQNFLGELENLATPMEEKGVETLGQAVQFAQKIELRDGKIATLQKQLDQLNLKKSTEKTVELKSPRLLIPQPGSSRQGAST